MRLQMKFQGKGFVVTIGGRASNLRRQDRDARIERRQLQVGRDKLGNNISRCLKLNGRGPGEVRLGLVLTDGALTIDIVNRSSRVDRQCAIRPADPAPPGSQKEYVCADRFQQNVVVNQTTRGCRGGLSL